MDSMPRFDYKKSVLRLLSQSDINIFDELMKDVNSYATRKVDNITDMRHKACKKHIGDIWEQICKDWLETQDCYSHVYYLSEWKEYSNSLPSSYQLGKQDIGIDLVAQLKNGNYVAIQCKYRKSGYVTWNTLSTFVGLCERSGPWEKYIVMTNAKGITRKMRKSDKDKYICLNVFKKTTREQWMKMCGIYRENKLANENVVEEKVNLDDVRQARIAKFLLKNELTR